MKYPITCLSRDSPQTRTPHHPSLSLWDSRPAGNYLQNEINHHRENISWNESLRRTSLQNFQLDNLLTVNTMYFQLRSILTQTHQELKMYFQLRSILKWKQEKYAQWWHWPTRNSNLAPEYFFRVSFVSGTACAESAVNNWTKCISSLEVCCRIWAPSLILPPFSVSVHKVISWSTDLV